MTNATTKPTKKVVRFFNAALARVESTSIRAWAQTDHNRPIMLQLAAKAMVGTGPMSGTPEGFAAFIVATAIGL